MSEVLSTPAVKPTLNESITALCKTGLYHDALSLAEAEWGAISTWNTQEKLLIAIRLYANLGGDRRSDAILLRLWRSNKTDPELLNRMMFYTLHKFGAIIASEFVEQHQATIMCDEKARSEVLAFKSILQKIFKNYSKSSELLEQARSINPDNTWLMALQTQLLLEQNELDLALEKALQNFEHKASPNNLRVLSNTLTKTANVEASIELYATHVDKFQSADVWFDYASLLAGMHDWARCDEAINQYNKLRIDDDKYDRQFIIAWQGQIAIDRQEIDKAIEILAHHKRSYWNVVTQNLKKSNGVLERKVLDVPFLKQEHMTCAPTTLAALSRYWGKEHDSKVIADAICFDGTPATKERQWLKDNDFFFKEFELSTELAYGLIEKDIPFALVTTSGFSAHIQAVIGFNRQVGTMYIMDPSESIMQEMLTQETIESEAYSGARCIAFVPNDQAQLLSDFEFPASELFPIWDDYSVAEEKNDYGMAKEALRRLQQLSPDHRITLRMERHFSVWNNDTVNLLELNNKLLGLFPNVTLLLSSKYYCLRDLGKREEGLAFLAKRLESHPDLDLLGILFDEIHDTNEQQTLTLATLKKLKKWGARSAYSHWSLANHYWSHQSFELAAEFYLNAYCLDETSSRYIESYFKASRYLQREHEAIAFLKERFDKYKLRSAVPAISLYKAYELLDQDHIGLDYLFQALTLHGDDPELINYLSNKLIERGLIERFEQISPQIKLVLKPQDFNELQARKHEKVGQFDRALTFFEASFEQNPYIDKYANSYFNLLYRRGDLAQIDSVLAQLYQQAPDNTQVLDYIADWHSDPEFQQKILTRFAQLRPDYGVIRRQLIDVRIKLGLFDRALAEAQSTCDDIIGEPINQSYLARCYLKLGEFDKTRDIARQVLSRSVDNDLAFSVLMEASISKEEKEASLAFVFGQIKQQVIFGDSTWNYWFEAKSILNQSQLQEFIDYLLTDYAHLWYAYSLGGSYYKQYGELTKAKELLVIGLEKYPLTPRLHADLAQLYELEGNIEQAIKSNNQALVLNPSWSEVAKRLSDLLEKHQDSDAATAVIRTAIKHSPNDGGLYGYLADLLIKQENTLEAIEALKSAVKNNADYRWAWRQFIHLCDKNETPQLVVDFATELTQQSPYKPHVWRDLAYVTQDKSHKLDLFQKSLDCDVHYMPTYQDKVEFYVNQGDYKQALFVLDNTPWHDELPMDLTIQKIDLLIEIGQKKQAIDSLKNVLFSVHGYAYLWRKLFNLLEEGDSKQQYIDCCNKSVELNRHDPDILCYAGENLLKHGNDAEKQIAQTYLNKAFELCPNEQYIVMTYVDSLIDSEKYQQALDAIVTFETLRTVSYATTRKIGVLCQLNRSDEALAAYQGLLNSNDDDYWCLNESFKSLESCFSFEQLSQLFSADVEALSETQSYFYTDKCLAKQKGKKFHPVLKSVSSYSYGSHWVGGFLALLEYWSDNNITPPEKAIKANMERIVKTSSLVGQLGNGYIGAGHYHSMVALFERVENKDELPTFVFYHYRLALQMLGRWDDATDAIMQGVQQPPDNTVHNLLLWYVYELHRTGQNITEQDIEIIDYDELIENEKYVYSTLRVILALDQQPLEDKLEQLTPLLRKCQQDYQHTVGQPLAVHAKKLLRRTLKDAVASTNWFTKLKLAWWISNRF